MSPPDTIPLHHGAAWYPELWPAAVWQEDLAKMRALGMNTVRIAEFAWSRLEPRRGEFDFDWLIQAMDLAHAHGIRVVLCTPTACPPLWLFESDPTMAAINPDGRIATHGGRHHASIEHPGYRKACHAIVTAMARALGSHPALIAWQTDNELTGNQDHDISPPAVAAWHRWLEQRYGSIAELNRAWHTEMWSQTYDRFEQVPPAGHPGTVGDHNNALVAAFRRFRNDSALAFCAEQCAWIRTHSSRPITHNSHSTLSEYHAARLLDFPSIDTYLKPADYWDVSYHLDTLRPLSGPHGFWIMETSSEHHEGAFFGEGWLACYAFAVFCSGGRGFCYWLWRQQPSGIETNHASILHSCGAETFSAVEAGKVGASLETWTALLAEFQPAPRPAALVRSELNGRYLHDISLPRPPGCRTWEAIHAHNRAQLFSGLSRDVVSDEAGLAGYRIVFVPYLVACSPDFIQRLVRFVEDGGTAVLGPSTSVRTLENTVPLNAILGDLESAFGFHTEHLLTCSTGVAAEMADNTPFEPLGPALVFSEAGATGVLGRYTTPSRLAGRPWGLRLNRGQGSCYVLGSELTEPLRLRLYASLLDAHDIPRFPMPEHVYRFPMLAADGRTAWGLINVGTAPASVPLPAPARERFSGLHADRSLDLPARSVAWLDFETPVIG